MIRSPAGPPIRSLCLALIVGSAGCLTVKPVVVDKKTELENQILGTFKRLEQDLILASSVRGAQPASERSPLAREALEAMLDREFNRDDIEQQKKEQLVGEGNDGLLKVLRRPSAAAAVASMTALVERENKARMVIMRRAVQLGRELSDKDLPLVRKIFYRLNAQTARPGDRVQQPGGAWQTVTGGSSPSATIKPSESTSAGKSRRP